MLPPTPSEALRPSSPLAAWLGFGSASPGVTVVVVVVVGVVVEVEAAAVLGGRDVVRSIEGRGWKRGWGWAWYSIGGGTEASGGLSGRGGEEEVGSAEMDCSR